MRFWSKKCTPEKSLQIAHKVPFGKGNCEQETQNNKPLPYEAQHAAGANGLERISVAYGNIPAPGLGR